MSRGGIRQVSAVGGGTIASGAAATPKSIAAMIAAANDVFSFVSWGVWVTDVVTASEKLWLVEICKSTAATAGTSTSVTPLVKSGSGNVRLTAAKNYTAEPTVLTVIEEFPLDPNKGWVGYTYAQGDEIISPVAGAIVIRITVPTAGATGNLRFSMTAED